MPTKTITKTLLLLITFLFTFACQKKRPPSTVSFENNVNTTSSSTQESTIENLPVQIMHFDTIDIEPSHDIVLNVD